MTKIITNNKKNFIYIAFVLLIMIFLIGINPIPITRGDLWAEDGKAYLAQTIRFGVWKAFNINFLIKGHPQLLKYILSYLSIIINQFLFDDNIIYYPHIAAFFSYLIYSLVFTLPIILFNNLFQHKILYMIPFISCFIAIGSYDIFVTFGRIINTGFLSIYLCFLLVAYRLLQSEKRSGLITFLIDIVLLLCIFTQPTNLLIVFFLYIKKIYQYLMQQNRLNLFPDLLLLTIGITTYSILILTNDLIILHSYGRSGFDGSITFSITSFFGIMMFNNFLAIIYSLIKNCPDFSQLFSFISISLFIFYLFLIYQSRSLLHWYSLYVLVAVALISSIWRPKLLDFLENGVGGFYAMPTLLISLFLTFSLISHFLENSSQTQVTNQIWLAVVIVTISNGIYMNQPTNIETISIEESLAAAQLGEEDIEESFVASRPGEDVAIPEWIQPDQEDTILYKLPINPDDWSMLLPEKYIPEKYIP